MLAKGNITKIAFWGALGLFISLTLTRPFCVTFAKDTASASVKPESAQATVKSESAQITKVIRIKHRDANEMKNLILGNYEGWRSENAPPFELVPGFQSQPSPEESAIVMEAAKAATEAARRALGISKPLVPEGVMLFVDASRNNLIVRGAPEDVKEVEELVKQLDTPLKRMKFRVRLIVASNEPNKPEVWDLPPEIGRTEIPNLFSFTSYKILADTVLHSEEGEKPSVGAEAEDKRYRVSFQPFFIDEGVGIIKLRSFSLDKAGPETGFEFMGQSSLLSTTLNVKNGNIVIVGGSTIDGGGKSLIVAVTAQTVE